MPVDNEIGAFVAGASGICDIAANGGVERLPRASGENAVDLPVSYDVVDNAVARRELIALADGKRIYDVEGQHMRDVEGGNAAASTQIVRILRDAAFHSVPARGAGVDGLAEGIGELVSETCGVALINMKLQGVVCAVADAPVVEGRCDVRIGSAQLGITGTRCKRGVVVASHVQTVSL